jgi:hypothetical protein
LCDGVGGVGVCELRVARAREERARRRKVIESCVVRLEASADRQTSRHQNKPAILFTTENMHHAHGTAKASEQAKQGKARMDGEEELEERKRA